MHASVLVVYREQLGGVNARLDLRAKRKSDGDRLIYLSKLPSPQNPQLQVILADELGVG